MKPRERIKLINDIAIKLQEEMTYAEINMYLPSFNINCKNHQPSTNSKRVYVQELLANENEQTIINIAEDLEIIYTEIVNHKVIPTFWHDGYFKLFISHLSNHKKKASDLQKVLKRYGISSFVAHEDIEPSKEWQNEIENALHTMDALTAILMDGFKESNWCDQEIGFALGKGVLIIPIKKDINPYGFIGKYQAIQATKDKTIGIVANDIFNVIVNNPKTKNKMIHILAALISNSTNINEAIERIKIIKDISNIPKEMLEKMVENIMKNNVLIKSNIFMDELKDLCKNHDISININYIETTIEIDEDNIPF